VDHRCLAGVVRSQRERQVAAKTLQQPLEVRGAGRDVLARIERVRGPEPQRGCRHQLHQALRAFARDRAFVEPGLHRDHGVQQLRRQLRFLRDGPDQIVPASGTRRPVGHAWSFGRRRDDGREGGREKHVGRVAAAEVRQHRRAARVGAHVDLRVRQRRHDRDQQHNVCRTKPRHGATATADEGLPSSRPGVAPHSRESPRPAPAPTSLALKVARLVFALPFRFPESPVTGPTIRRDGRPRGTACARC
jgi:hypothetical protein